MQSRNWIVDYGVAAVMVLLAGLLLLPALDYGLWEPWEGKYAQSAVEMMERGDYLTPFFRGETRFSKPILPYWMILVSYKGLGISDVSTRLPFAAFGVATIGVFVFTLCRLFNRTLGFLAGFVLLTSPIFYFEARQAVPDILFVGNMAMALCFVMLGMFQDRHRGWWMFLFYVMTALAVLSKGPIALVILIATIGLYAALTLEFSERSIGQFFSEVRELLFTTLRLHWGIPLVLALTLPWYIYNAYHYEVFLDRLHFDYIKRFTKPEGGHDGGIAYYVEPIVYGLFPWCALVPVAVLGLRVRPKRVWRAVERKHIFFVCWFVCAFLLFSAAETKFRYYIFPAIPPLAFVTGLFLSTYVKRPPRPATFFALFPVAVGVFLLPARVLDEDQKLLFGSFTIKNAVRAVVRNDINIPDPNPVYLVLMAAFAGLLLSAGLLAYTRLRVVATIGLCVTAYALSLFNAQMLVPSLSPHKGQRVVIDNIKKSMEPGDKIAIYYPGRDNYQYKEWSAIESSAIFYTNNEISELKTKKDLRRFFKKEGAAYCIVRRKYLARLKKVLQEDELNLPMHIIDSSHYRFRTITVKDPPPDIMDTPELDDVDAEFEGEPRGAEPDEQSPEEAAEDVTPSEPDEQSVEQATKSEQDHTAPGPAPTPGSDERRDPPEKKQGAP